MPKGMIPFGNGAFEYTMPCIRGQRVLVGCLFVALLCLCHYESVLIPADVLARIFETLADDLRPLGDSASLCQPR